MNILYKGVIHVRRLVFIIATIAGASCISLIGGIGLEIVQLKLLPLVPLVIALPALNTAVGDYASIIAAHAGDPAQRRTTMPKLARAIFKAVWVNIAGILVLASVIAWQRDYLFTSLFGLKFVLFTTFAMLGVIGIIFGITILLDILLEKHRLNPDEVLIPVVTTVTDVFMLGMVALSATLLF